MTPKIRIASTIVLGLAASAAGAQNVYKCQSGRSVSYSHEPCVGAQVVDTTPTQGMDHYSGRKRTGADVQKTEYRKLVAEALKPLTGMDAQQFEKTTARQKLAPGSRLQCDLLDARLPRDEAQVAQARKGAMAKAEVALFESRKRYRELGC